MSNAVVEIDDVTKSFDILVVVNRISLRVDEGQALGLVGPNGAGKTTPRRLIAALAMPARGDVTVLGQSVFSAPRLVRGHLRFMPVEFGSPRNLTIEE